MTVTAAAAVEIVLVAFYLRFDAVFHWLVHFLVGGSTALVLVAAVTVMTGRRCGGSGLLVVIISGHLFAAVPDVLFRLGIAHAHWMDLFGWHLESHFTPGGLVTWYAVFLACLAVTLIAQRHPRRGLPVVAALAVGTTLVLAHERVPPELTSAAHVVHLVYLLLLPVAIVSWAWWYARRSRASRFPTP